jgi:hypothetical protein
MVPPIRGRQQVVVAPVDPARVEVGDVVLARVAGRVHPHLVSSVDHAGKQAQISDRVKGWTGHDRVFDIRGAVDGAGRSGAAGRARPRG